MPSIFGYWTLRGLGQASRFVLEYTGEEYQDVRFDAVSIHTCIADSIATSVMPI